MAGTGWTSLEPESHHYPEIIGGEMIALFYLPRAVSPTTSSRPKTSDSRVGQPMDDITATVTPAADLAPAAG